MSFGGTEEPQGADGAEGVQGAERTPRGLQAAGPAAKSTRLTRLVAIAGAEAVLLASGGVLLAAKPWQHPGATQPVSTALPSSIEVPHPEVPGFAANTTSYDPATLPKVDVFAVIPELLIDDPKVGHFTGELATPVAAGAPVFADPTGDPIAYLPRELTYGGTTVPVLERQEHWVRVLLVGRQAKPSQGNAGQVAGWLRVQDVEFTASDAYVKVSLSDRTIDVVRGGESTRIATDFGSGQERSPTPVGRAFIMQTQVVPSMGYTRGHPVVYLSNQSPKLDGFGGVDVAVAAFHYHDVRSGEVSNGCIRVGAEVIDQLETLPAGTLIIIHS